MVQSKINSKISYEEIDTINDDDISSEVTVHDLLFEIDNKEHTIVFGNKKNDYIHKDIIFYPIYLVVKDNVHSQIGVIEFTINEITKYLDEENDIDTIPTESLRFYSFVTNAFLKEAEQQELNEFPNKSFENIEENENENDTTDNLQEIDFTDDDFTSPKGSLFEEVPGLATSIYLPEETKQDSKEAKDKYRDSENDEDEVNWLCEYFKNSNYSIYPNEGCGDCFFATIRDAFEQDGKKITIENLRSLVRDETTESMYKDNRDIYLDLQDSINGMKKDIDKNIAVLKEYRKRIKDNNLSKTENKEIIELAKSIKSTNEKLKYDKISSEKMMNNEFSYLQKLDTYDKYKDYLMTSSYWANMSTIAILEYKLNVKFIIFSKESYTSDDFDNVLLCGEIYEKLQNNGIFEPENYIICSYTGSHYELIGYKKKKLFSFREIPYDVKELVVNKCLEKNAGGFNLIHEFREHKKKLGYLYDNDSSEKEDDSSCDGVYELYNPDIVFSFHSKAQNKIKPGNYKSAGETIPKSKSVDFINLNKIDHWRRKLDDSYPIEFELDGHKWQSVLHYYQASKYRKTHPDYYLQFSLDSKSEVSKDPLLAKEKGSLNKQDSNVSIDPDFYASRSLSERNDALEQKFAIKEFKKILKLTHPAKLIQYKKKQEPYIDNAIMKIRKSLV